MTEAERARMAALDRVVEAARKMETAVDCKDRLLDRPQQALRDALLALDALPAPEPQPAGDVVEETVTLHGIVQQDETVRDPLNAVRIDSAIRPYTHHRILAHFSVTIPRRLLIPTIPATVTQERGE